MIKEMEQLIRQDSLELEKKSENQLMLPVRLKSLVLGQKPKMRHMRMIILAWVSLYGMFLSLFTLGHFLWIPILENWKKQEPAKNMVVLNPHPAELANTISQAFLEVTRWEE